MAFESEVQVLTQPGANGNQTYNLARVTNPKAVILFATPRTADGSSAHRSFGIGFGTYRGSAVKQAFTWTRGTDAALSADLARGEGIDAVLVLPTQSAGAATRDLEIDLVSMAGGGSPQVVLNWVNRHTTASIRVFMLVIGGSDVTDAFVDEYVWNTATTTQDVTCPSSFGRPELVFCMGDDGGLGESAESPVFYFGFGKQGEAGRGFCFSEIDGNTTALTAWRQRSNRVIAALLATGSGTATDRILAQLDTTVGNWPTDGFRLVCDANPPSARSMHFLAIRTSAEIATGEDTAPVSGTPPVLQDDDVGFTPKLALVFGWNQPASTGQVTSSLDADLGAFGLGAYDGTQEAWAGYTEADSLGTMDANSQQSTAKLIQHYDRAAALQSEADGVFTGTIFRRSWNDIDSIAREHQWLVVGDVLAVTARPVQTVVSQAVQRAATR